MQKMIHKSHFGMKKSYKSLLQLYASTSSNDTIYASIGCEESCSQTGAITPPIHFSTTYERDAFTLELSKGFNYSRLGNPTRLEFEKAMVKVENGEIGFAFSSGMQAITSLLLSNPKAHILLPNDIYHGVIVLVKEILSQWGLTYEKIDMTNHNEVQLALLQGQERLNKNESNKIILWMETPSNPKCIVTDINELSKLAKNIIKEDQLVVAVDATWSTPYLLQPLQLGADVVMQSSTKYIGGHSDVLGGTLVLGSSIGAKTISPLLMLSHQIGGGVLGPFDSWLSLRGLRTLPVRMKQHCQSALKLAEFLNSHKQVEHVYYPGLPSHPQHILASKMMRYGMYGGMLSFLVKGDINQTLQVSLNYTLILYLSSFFPMMLMK